jgi:uncharacterized membrane protein
MNREDEIKNLENEIHSLQQELLKQRQQLLNLDQRLKQLNAEGDPLPARRKEPLHQPVPSLENFIGLKVMHLIGIIVLVAGLSLGVKYAIDKELISELARIFLAYLAGAILFVLSLRLKSRYNLFSAILFSGAMATFYFTTYGSLVYYQLISFSMAFAVMTALTVFTVYQANLYNRQEIAALGLVGAYAIPFLISKNQENATMFFLYITLINTGILFLCIKKPWRLVGKLAQYITWALFIAWAGMKFTAVFQVTAVIFMIVFFVMFLFLALSRRIFRKDPLSIDEIYQLVLNTLLFYMAAMMIWGNTVVQNEPAYITLFFSILSAIQALVLNFSFSEKRPAMSMVNLSLLFFLVFIALRWDGITVTLLWLLVAILCFAAGVKMKWGRARMISILILGTTLFKLVAVDSLTFTTVQKVISYISLGVLLLIFSFYYQRYRSVIFPADKEG